METCPVQGAEGNARPFLSFGLLPYEPGTPQRTGKHLTHSRFGSLRESRVGAIVVQAHGAPFAITAPDGAQSVCGMADDCRPLQAH